MQSRLTRQKHILSPSRIGFGIGAIVLLLVVVFNGFIGSIFSGFVAVVLNPGGDLYDAVPRSILASRLEDAENELARIRYQGLLYTLEVEKYQELVASLGLPEEEVSGRGRIFARPPKTHYDTLLVSLAPESTVAEGDQAYVSGILVGEVNEVRSGQAKVVLYSSPETVLDARIGEPSAIVVMHGLGGGAFFLEVPKEVSIAKGEPILLAHSDVLVAQVQRIIDEPEQTTYRVYAASPIASSDMRIVEFVKKITISFE